MPTLWFSYSSGGGDLDAGEPLSSPYTIWYHVGRFLREKAADIGYGFKYVELTDTTPQVFSPDDIVIGHTWWDGGFINLALDAAIKGKFILQPYSHGMVSPGDAGMVLNLFNKADHLFLITGEYWWNTMQNTPYAALKSKATRLDMAVNVEKHPYSKTHWNKAGQRAVCVIGHDTPTKGYANVAELARVAGFRLGHFGSSDGKSFEHVPCFTAHGGHVFTPEVITWLCREYDVVMALPEADANPTVLLEAAAWGLRVYASQESGYTKHSGLVMPLRKDNMQYNVRMMRHFQQADEYELAQDSEFQRLRVERDYTFDRMCRTIWQKVSEYL